MQKDREGEREGIVILYTNLQVLRDQAPEELGLGHTPTRIWPPELPWG